MLSRIAEWTTFPMLLVGMVIDQLPMFILVYSCSHCAG